MTDINVDNLPHREAIQFIQDKLLIPARQWENMVGPINAKAFTVAGATKLQLLQDMFQAILNAQLDGTTLTDFRKEFDRIVERHGWSYKGKRGWRTAVIFRTNRRTSFMAGKWAQFQRLKERRPYLQYLTVGDERVRESHRPWHRIVLGIDHPFWKTHYPPNGWLCRCSVRSLSKAELDKQGLTPTKMDTPKASESVDPKTGELVKKHTGIDIGWDYNAGKAWLAPDVLLGQQLMDLPADLRADAIRWFDGDIYDRPFASLVNSVGYRLAKGTRNISTGNAATVGIFTPNVLDALGQRGQVPVGATLVARDSDVAHWLRDSKAEGGRAVSITLASTFPQTFRNPDAILWDTEKPSLIYTKALGDGRYAKFVVRLNFKSKLNVNKSRFNETLNTVTSAGIVDWSALNNSRYEVLQGAVRPGGTP